MERWIYNANNHHRSLNWKKRGKIILDFTKRLTYLTKSVGKRSYTWISRPQNIFLGEDLNVEVADFGLSKFGDMTQSGVFMTTRGNSGYLVLEWIFVCITEKVDVYCFGILVPGLHNLNRHRQTISFHKTLCRYQVEICIVFSNFCYIVVLKSCNFPNLLCVVITLSIIFLIATRNIHVHYSCINIL